MPAPVRAPRARAGLSLSNEHVDPAVLAKSLESYLADNPTAAVLEEGRLLFDMRSARYSITESHGRCLLQLWSEERNLLRTVAGVQERAQCLRVLTRRMGFPKPQALEFVPTIDRRTPTARDTARRSHVTLVERAMGRHFVGWKVEGLRSAMDLEHSFGPAYARGRLVRGTSSDAVISVGGTESASTIDGVLTLGLLWLNYCREHGDARRHVGTLKVIVPEGTQCTTAERMTWLNHDLARFELYTLDERTEELRLIDFRDTGNIESRLVQAFSQKSAIDICRGGIDRVLQIIPEAARGRVELLASSPAEVGLLIHGLEFARVRLGLIQNSFTRELEITIGTGAHETPLTADNDFFCRDLLERLFASRYPDGSYGDPLFRLQPERWLESQIRSDLGTILPGGQENSIYSQVPALSANDRGMLDLLTLDQNGRLVVLELKTDEDLHLPLQALDYWIRVRALNLDRKSTGSGRELSAFERMGYFPGREVSPESPRLVLAAPALRVHPANEPVLRFFSPQVTWELLGLSEHWRRDSLSVIFRKRSNTAQIH